MSNTCEPIVSRKFIRVDGTEFDILLGNGNVFNLRDLETWYGEHIISGTTCTTANLLLFLREWGVYNSSGSSVYIKTTNTIIPNSDTSIGDIPLGDSLIIKYNTSSKTMLWLYANDGTLYRYLNNAWFIENLNTSNFISNDDINVTVAGLENGLLNPNVIPNLAKEIVYGISMNALNALQTKSEEILYIDLNERIQYYWDGNSFIPYGSSELYATQQEAEDGILENVIISPKTAKDAIEFHKANTNVLESTTLNSSSTNNTGTSIKIARKDHTHKIEGFSLVNHTHTNGLVIDNGHVVTMDNHTVVDIDASTLEGNTVNDFATAIQGGKADTSIQNVTLGGISIKDGTTAILPAYPINSDFKISLLKDYPTGATNKKILVTNSTGGFDFKDYVSETEHNYSNLINKPTISIDALNTTDLTDPWIFDGNLVLHPIATNGILTSLSDVNVKDIVNNDVLQYKSGEWTNTPLDGLINNLQTVTFNSLGNGNSPNVTYDGTIARTISYNSIGASPLSHTHALSGLTGVSFIDLTATQTLSYNGTAWVNVPKYTPANLTFNNSGSGSISGTVYDGSTTKTISYNSIGAASSSHTHALENLSNISISNLQSDQILKYNGTSWINTTATGGSITTYNYDIAFVDAGGNDSTAEIGNINKPYATIQAAVIAISSTTNPMIQVMSNLSITESISITNSLIISIYNGVVIDYINETEDKSLFMINSGSTLTIDSLSAKFLLNSGTYLNSFATINVDSINNHSLILQNIEIEHVVTSVFTTIATIFCNNKSLLKTYNCHILTRSSSTNNNIQCCNICSIGNVNHILELVDTKLTIINNANGGLSVHILDTDSPTKTSLINCKTIQILSNFVNPTSDPIVPSAWSEIKVMGTEFNDERTNYTISNCKFYINTIVQTRTSDSWNRYVIWPTTSYSGGNAISIANVANIRRGGSSPNYTYDVIEYLGTSLHNYGKTFGDSETTAPPTQYGGVYTTSLVRCPLLQPYEI